MSGGGGKYIYIGVMVWVFANGPGDLGSITGRVIPKTPKMVLGASLLNSQYYKVRIKVKLSKPEKEVAPSSIEKGAFGAANLYIYIYIYIDEKW